MENSLSPKNVENHDFALVFNFGKNADAGRITVRFSPEMGMETVTNEILELFKLRANLRNIDGVVRKSGMLPTHRRFNLAFYCMGTNISSSLAGEEYSPKCLTTTINQIVGHVFAYTMRESASKVRMVKGLALAN